MIKKITGLINAQAIESPDGEAPQTILKRLFLESCPSALRADNVAAITGEIDPYVHLIGSCLKPSKKSPHTIKILGTINDGILLLFFKAFKRDIHRYLFAPA